MTDTYSPDTRTDRCAQPFDRCPCRYCDMTLILAPERVLSDGTQTYHWIDKTGGRSCDGRRDGRGGPGSPFHRPVDTRLPRAADPNDVPCRGCSHRESLHTGDGCQNPDSRTQDGLCKCKEMT